MLFHSKYSLYTVWVRGEIQHFHPVTGVLLNTTPRLVAEFGQLRGEFKFKNYLTGQVDTAADISGHYFDSDVAAEQFGWTDDEKESVEAALLRQCQEEPTHCQLVNLTPPPPDKPWASYDQTELGKIADLAESLNLVAEALAYEKAVHMRSTVIRKLESRLPKSDVETAVAEALEEVIA